MSKKTKNKFLAKSNPLETIMEHTEILLQEYVRISTIYPNFIEKIPRVWKVLYLVCVYHDWGKINFPFQNRILTGKKQWNELPHAILSIACLNAEELSKEFSMEEIQLLYSAILFHHNRENLLEYKFTQIKAEFQEMSVDISEMLEIIQKNPQKYPLLNQEKIYFNSTFSLKKYFYQEFPVDILNPKECEKAVFYILLKGLLNRIDYAASAHIPVEHKNDFLEKGLETFMQDLNVERTSRGMEKSDWNDLQEYMKSHQEDNVIVVAQTGLGKTEAGLWWIGDHKGFFILPLRTAIDAIYDRIKNKIIKNDRVEERLALLHGESLESYLQLWEK